MDTGTTAGGHRNSRKVKVTLGSMAEAYRLYCDTLSLAPDTVDSYQRSVRLLCAFIAPETPASDLSELDLQRWMKTRRDAGISPNTVRGDLRRLRSGFMAWATERRLIRHNWARLAKMPMPEERELRGMTRETFLQLIAATADSKTERRDRAVLWLLWDTGARIGEITRLNYEHILFDRKEVWFPASVTKTGVERFVPIFPDTISAIYDYLAFDRGQSAGPLWQNSRTKQPLAEQALKHVVRELGILAGVKVGAHDFRRGLVERLQAMDPPMPDTLIQQITGHRSLVMVSRYGRRTAAESARKEYRRRMTS